MVFNSDWLLSQIRGTANMIGKVFKLENIQIDLGMTEDEAVSYTHLTLPTILLV